ENICLADNCTTHTILKNKKYFQCLTLNRTNVNTISSFLNLIEGFRRANIMLPKETKFYINDALYSSKSRRNLLSFKDIRHNGYHVETINKGNNEHLYIISMI
ncbi:hypothetical protein I3760_04G163900, partial [Carya illinoinensis]